jgi:HlyD family secretion protein
MSGFLCALPLVSSLLSGCAGDGALAVGYVEGDYVNIAPVTQADLVSVDVVKGDNVIPGQLLARQDRADAEIALAEATAARDQAAAELANLREGSRPEEIAVTEASLASARVRLREAQSTADRQAKLAGDGVISQALLDRDIAARDMAAADVAELEARLAVARLPARAQVVAAAESRLAATEAARSQAAWRLDRRTIAAPAAGTISEVFHRAGEMAGPAAPILSILPDGAVRLVVYVGEPDVAGLAAGGTLDVRCDGCPTDLTATISHVADSPEFTPPVIYSVENRQKLVYRVEALPDAGADILRPGQIVDVSLARP